MSGRAFYRTNPARHPFSESHPNFTQLAIPLDILDDENSRRIFHDASSTYSRPVTPNDGEGAGSVHPVEQNSSTTELVGTNNLLEETTQEAGIVEGDTRNDEEKAYPGAVQMATLTLGLCLATFTVALDTTIIATAIPKITTIFDSLDDVGWYGSSYLLTTTALQPSFGKIYQNFPVKAVYLWALCLFELGSVICATATSSIMLIIGRAVAGAGASALYSGGLTIIGYSMSLQKRAAFIAILSSMFGIASFVGPLLGGVFTDSRLTWRFAFWVNVPFGAIAFATVFFFFKDSVRETSKLSFKQKTLEIDLWGALFLICAIVCLLLALQWGGTTYPWGDSRVWGCMLGFGILMIIFIGLQVHLGDHATIPPMMYRQRTVLFSCLYASFLAMGFNVHIYYIPFYFQSVKGTTAEGSGIRTIPYVGASIISAVMAGALMPIVGYFKPFMILGGAIFAAGSGLIYTFDVQSSSAAWIGYQFLAGFGVGLGIQLPFTAIQTVVKEKDMPSGNAMVVFFNSLGGALSISLAHNVFSNGLKMNLQKYAPNISAQQVIDAGATHLREAVDAIDLPRLLLAYSNALDNAFVIPIVVSGIAVTCGVFVEWTSVKAKKLTQGPGARNGGQVSS